MRPTLMGALLQLEANLIFKCEAYKALVDRYYTS
jgi:hypothetical protein